MKHIICIKLFDANKAPEVRERLLSMKGKVPQLENIWVGVDFLHSARSFDVVMIAELSGRNVLDDYQNDPYHVSVKEYLKTVAEKTVALDCE